MMPDFRSLFQPKAFLLSCVCMLASCIQLSAQTAINPYRVTIFQDAAQIGSKGIVKFDQQHATIPLQYPVNAETVYLVSGDSETKIKNFKVKLEPVTESKVAENCAEILKANQGKVLTVVIDAGPEVDELTGVTNILGDNGEMLALKSSGDKEFFIPIDQVKQVIISGRGKTVFEQKQVKQSLEIGLEKDAPFVPIEMFSFHHNVSWIPVCRIRILGADKARLQLTALITNDFADLGEVDVELSTSNILLQGEQNGELINAGKLSLNKGEKTSINLRDQVLEYTTAFQSRIAWTGPLTNGNNNKFPVDNLLRFKVPSLPGFACEYYAIIDEENRQVANVLLNQTGANGPLELNLGREKLVHVNVLENEIKRSKKAVMVGEIEFDKISIEGKILCYNLGQKHVQLQVQRDIKGDVIENEKAKLATDPDDPSLKSIHWRVSLDKGKKKEITYKYDTYVPIKK